MRISRRVRGSPAASLERTRAFSDFFFAEVRLPTFRFPALEDSDLPSTTPLSLFDEMFDVAVILNLLRAKLR